MKWWKLFEAAKAVVDKKEGSMALLKEVVRGFDTPEVIFSFDSDAKGISEEEVRNFVESQVSIEMQMGDEAFHCIRRGRGTKIWVQGLLEDKKYFTGQYFDDGICLSASHEPGDWLAWSIEQVIVSVVGRFRVVEIYLYISPEHDSHTRFGPAVYECYCRLEGVQK